MQVDLLNELKGISWIRSNGKHWVLVGKKLWICSQDGTMIVCKEDIPNAHTLCFLPDDRLLLCGGNGTSYRLFSLEDGKEIWTVPHIKKMSVTGPRFAVSSDGKWAFDFYDWKGSYCFVKIDLTTGTIDTFELRGGLRAIVDIICDAEDRILLLQTQYDQLDGRHICENEVRQVDLTTKKTERLHYWQMDAPFIAKGFLGCATRVLTQNLCAVDVASGAASSIVANTPEWEKPGLGPHDFWFAPETKYLCVAYDNANVIIDLQEKKMVARYSGRFIKGYLRKNQYWMPTEIGVESKPFPLIEEIPPRKLTYF